MSNERQRQQARERRQQARAQGLTTYRGVVCKRDLAHGDVRYTSTGRCVGCAAEQAAERAGKPKPSWLEGAPDGPRKRARPIAEAKARARAQGLTTYEGKTCKHDPGHGGTRYVSNGNCVGCAKERWGAEFRQRKAAEEAGL